jgi:16S rRNA (cytosine967-C5)-methyltransferase
VYGKKPREIAVQVLGRREGQFVENLLETALAASHLTIQDRHLCQELVYGIIRWQATLDWLISRKTNQRPQKPALQNLLRLGLYQLFWLDRIPAHAAVHETVELAKHAGFGPQSGFINAVLRGYVRELEPTRELLSNLKTTQPATGYSHPDWLAQRWSKRWGAEKAAQLMAWNNTPPKTYARINTLKANAEKLLPQWREENVEYDFFQRDWLEEHTVFELKGHPPLAKIASFKQGGFYIQDPSTLLAPRLLAPQPGQAVLDLCAAPGGKLTYLAQLTRNEGRLVAYDIVPERMKLVTENCARLGVTCTVLDPASPKPEFDQILIDAPCSNTGVMRRRVDLRWRIRVEEILRLRTEQLNLLRQAAAWLKPGGAMVYSTCSLEPEENTQVVMEFLAAEPGFKLERERELLPFADAVDGAYAARIIKAG